MSAFANHEVKTKQWPYVAIGLIGLNLLILAFEASLGPRLPAFLEEWGLVAARVHAHAGAGDVATLATSLFLHVGIVHLGLNLWFLYVFADIVEDALGHGWFLALYLAAGFCGGLAIIAAGAGGQVPVVGASAAIAGVMAASLGLWPRARMKVSVLFLVVFVLLALYPLVRATGLPGWLIGGPVLFVVGSVVTLLLTRRPGARMKLLLRSVWVPAWLVMALWLGLQALTGTLALTNPVFADNFGWWAFAGGFVCGGVCGYVFRKHRQALVHRRALSENVTAE